MTSHKAEKAYKKLLLSIRDNDGVECEQFPDFYYPEDYSGGKTSSWDVQFAKTICGRCPTKFECLDYALAAHEDWGIWGGLTAHERKTFRR
jgi:WhiB family redox-sensing transcriptional regulator